MATYRLKQSMYKDRFWKKEVLLTQNCPTGPLVAGPSKALLSPLSEFISANESRKRQLFLTAICWNIITECKSQSCETAVLRVRLWGFFCHVSSCSVFSVLQLWTALCPNHPSVEKYSTIKPSPEPQSNTDTAGHTNACRQRLRVMREAPARLMEVQLSHPCAGVLCPHLPP